MKKIGFIAPYLKLAEEAEIVGRLTGIRPVTRIADGYEAISVAEEMINEGVGVIISRGGTAIILKDSSRVRVPVVELYIQAMDIMRAIKTATEKTDRICVCGYENVLVDLDSIADVFGISILRTVTDKDESIEVKTEKIKTVASSVDHIVGDAKACQIAARFGLESTLIESGMNAIMAALEESGKILKALEHEEERTEEIKKVLDCTHESIVLLDRELSIRFANNRARDILDEGADPETFRADETFAKIKEIFATKKPIIDAFADINSRTIMYNAEPVLVDNKVVGVVVVFQDIGKIQSQESKVRNKIYLKGHVAEYSFDDIIHSGNRKMEQCIEMAKLYSDNGANTLIYGETGTGKELFAQSIHNYGERKDGPFVAINCGAVPNNLLESELFGYVSGAFTGANKNGKPGMFELADGGTLFLDEISEISENLQVKLLRAVNEKKIMRLGGDMLIPIDVRIIAATNKNLRKMISEGTFREDLYYRLNVLSLTIPTLRERAEDMESLVKFFTAKYCVEHKLEKKTISEDGIEMLQGRKWRGNVRELENIIERLVILVSEGEITGHHIEKFIDEYEETDAAEQADEFPEGDFMKICVNRPMEEIKRDIINHVLKQNGGDKAKTADALGMSRTTIWRKANEKEDRPE